MSGRNKAIAWEEMILEAMVAMKHGHINFSKIYSYCVINVPCANNSKNLADCKRKCNELIGKKFIEGGNITGYKLNKDAAIRIKKNVTYAFKDSFDSLINRQIEPLLKAFFKYKNKDIRKNGQILLPGAMHTIINERAVGAGAGEELNHWKNINGEVAFKLLKPHFIDVKHYFKRKIANNMFCLENINIKLKDNDKLSLSGIVKCRICA